MITNATLTDLIGKKKAYEQAAASVFNDDVQLNEHVSLKTLKAIAQETARELREGSHNFDGTPATYYVDFCGCHFWAMSNYID